MEKHSIHSLLGDLDEKESAHLIGGFYRCFKAARENCWAVIQLDGPQPAVTVAGVEIPFEWASNIFR